MAAYLPEGVSLVRRGKFQGESFGESTYTLYEACSPEQQEEEPCLLVWLHGQDMVHIAASDIRGMQRRMERRVFCLVPRNPEVSGHYRRFFWALGFTKAQNRSGLGFVYGEMDTSFLESLNTTIREISVEVGASHVVACGYSMGGFGCYQLAAHAPDLYDAIVSVAGHGVGTLEPQHKGYGAPQPESSNIFNRFIEEHAPGLAAVPLVLAVHARRDTVSNIHDTECIVKAIQDLGGCAELVEVPEDMADSDLSKKKSKSKTGHAYYYYTLLHETSEEVIYSRLRPVLTAPRGEAVLPTPKPVGEAAGEEAEQEAAPESAPAADVTDCSREEVLGRVKARLESNSTTEHRPAIRRFVEDTGLSDGVELALQMLAPEHLSEILSGEGDIKAKLAKVEEADASMLWLISQLDAEASALVARLQEVEGEEGDDAAEEAEEAPADGAAGDADAVLAQARERLSANEGAKAVAIRALRNACGFGSRGELALRLLERDHLWKLFAKKEQLKAEARCVPDKDQHFAKLAFGLDPSIEPLFDRLSEADGIEATQQENGHAKPVGPVRTERSRSRSRGRNGKPTPGANQGGAAAEVEDVDDPAVAEASRRLDANRHTPHFAAVHALRTTCGFGDVAELALRILSPAHLRQILGQKVKLQNDLASAADKDQHVLTLVAQLDPAVDALVCRIIEISGPAAFA